MASKPSRPAADGPSASTPSAPEFVILGSGVSTALPRISCIIRPGHEFYCEPCHDAVRNPDGPNRRCNVSALVRLAGKTILIDCGKTTREAAIRHFPKLGVQNVDAIVLTHGHADAILGLDDSRDIQHEATQKTLPDGKIEWIPPAPTPIYLNEETLLVCQNVFPYLVPEDQRVVPPELRDATVDKGAAEKKKDIPRRVASLKWKVYLESDYFKPFRPLEGVDIEFTPFPMLHGGTYICMGFLIKMRETPDSGEIVILYMSDLHDLPEESDAFIDDIKEIDLLVIDVLTRSQKNKSHFYLDKAKDMVRRLNPRKAVAVGMTCSLGLHDVVNKELSEMDKEGIDFRLAFDGQVFRY